VTAGHSRKGTGPGPADTAASPALDEAFDRMAATDFELSNGFVNHGPMACEALAALGCEEEIDGWARWFASVVGDGPTPVAPSPFVEFDWQGALGDYASLPEWLGYFDAAIADAGWSSVVELWVPRLIPALSTALFHGAIRTAHAVRAIDRVDTVPRRSELARALGYWAARFRSGQPAPNAEPVDEIARSVSEAAADAARFYLASPNIFNLHGVTGAMALELLVDHIPAEAGVAALVQVRAEHAAMFTGREQVGVVDAGSQWDEALAHVVASSRDAHQVKLVEACRRGVASIGDPVFVAAAEQVAGRH
jgi:hypothetical protein